MSIDRTFYAFYLLLNKRLPGLLLCGHKMFFTELSKSVTIGPSRAERVFSLNNAIQKSLLHLDQDWICASVWSVACQYVEVDVALFR